MKTPASPTDFIQEVVEMLLAYKAVKAVKYLSPIGVIRAVRRKKIGVGIQSKRENIQITLTLGRPNYLEREFIRLFRKAGGTFPIQRVQLKYYNPKPKKLSRKK